MENNQKTKFSEIVQKMDNSVLSVIGSDKINGFEKSYLVASAINSLSELLTAEFMKPIMALQGNRLGFKTDKDKTGGYIESVVKNCLIEAVLLGIQPTGNQFNIIAGNMYPTKEGCGYLLNNFKGLSYNLVCSLPRINADKTSAAVEVSISWEINGEKKENIIPIPIKMDAYTSVDALIGKATKKGRAWLLSRVSGMEITDGDVQDVQYLIEKETPVTIDEANETERIFQYIKNSNNLEELEMVEEYLDLANENQVKEFNDKKKELNKALK